MDHKACDFFLFRETSAPYSIYRHTSWASAYNDKDMKLDQDYSSAGSLGRAIQKRLNGRVIPSLARFAISHVSPEPQQDADIGWTKPKIQFDEPYRILPTRNTPAEPAPTSARTEPCAHRCFNKMRCKHPCCKITDPESGNPHLPEPVSAAMQVPTTTDSPSEPHAENLTPAPLPSTPSSPPTSVTHRPCKHICRDKANCKHRCCKVGVPISPRPHPERATATPLTPSLDERSTRTVQSALHEPRAYQSRETRRAHDYDSDRASETRPSAARWSLRSLIPWTSQNERAQLSDNVTTEAHAANAPLEDTNPHVTALPDPLPIPNNSTPALSNEVQVNRRPCLHKCQDKARCLHKCCKEGVLVSARPSSAESSCWSLRSLFLGSRPPAERQINPDGSVQNISISRSQNSRLNQSTEETPTTTPTTTSTTSSSQTRSTGQRNSISSGDENDQPTPNSPQLIRNPENQPEPPLLRSSRSLMANANRSRAATSRLENVQDTPGTLLSTLRTIEGGRIMIHLSSAQWQRTEEKALERCTKFLSPAESADEATAQAELLTACLAVSAYEVASEADPTGGFRIRTNARHNRRRTRPLAAERSAKQLETHVRQLKATLRYTHGRAERNHVKGQLKEAVKLQKVYMAEGEAQRLEMAQRWAHTRFQRNPWTAGSECIDNHEKEAQQRNGKHPDIAPAEVESYFRGSMETTQECGLPPKELLGPQADRDMTWEAIDSATIAAAVSSKRHTAAPGSDTVSNALLKRCPALHPFLAQSFNDLFKFGVCPDNWKKAVTLLVHKSGPTQNVSNWRPISLTSCLGKLFHSIVSHRIQEHVTGSGVIDTTIQKGFLPGVNGCIEHTQALCELLDHQRQHKRQYCLGQYDLKNAFGSLPHYVLFSALEWARLPTNVITYIRALYTGASMQVKCAEGLTGDISITRGVLQGDTLSPVLFLIAMEVVLRYLRSSLPKYGIVWDTRETFIKAFADDLTLVTSTPDELQRATNVLHRVLTTMGLRLNVGKCRVQHMAVLNGGYKTHRPRIVADGQVIPHICNKGSLFLGMTLAPGAQQGKVLFKTLQCKLRKWLGNITESAFDQAAKMWIYNNAIISRLRYVLTVNTGITFNYILRLQKLATNQIRKWLNVAKTATSELFYSERGWRMMSISKLWLQCTATAISQMSKSRDPAVQYALRHRIANEQRRRSSGHVRPAARFYDMRDDPDNLRRTINDEYERHLIESVQRRTTIACEWFQMATESDLAKDFASALCNVKSSSLSRFAASVLTQTPLPTRSSLRRWGISSHTNVACPICGEATQTPRHILTGCKVSLEQGRYTYRHDLILLALADAVANSPTTSSYHFDVDLYRNSPPWLSHGTELRPDGWVRLHNGSEYIIELTSPWEENLEYAHERKVRKYTHLYTQRRLANPSTFLLVFEVGARGKLNSSARAINSLFGTKAEASKCREKLVQRALLGSFHIYQQRENPNWYMPSFQ